MLGLTVSEMLEQLVEHLTGSIPGFPLETLLKQACKNKDDLMHKAATDTLN